MIKLNIGSNNVIFPDWDNLDILDIPGAIKYDARTKLPYDDNSVDFIFSEHFIEHMDETGALFYFSECYRVLKPGGVVRTSTFNIDDIIIGLHSSNWNEFKEVYCGGVFKEKTRIEFFNLCVYEGNLHKYMYNPEEMERFLLKSGFKEFNFSERSKSFYPELENREWRANSTCIVEATK